MKKIFCVLLALIICMGLCACSPVVIDENGRERQTIYNGEFVILEEIWDYSNYIIYDPETKIVFYHQGGHGGYLTPYQIYQDGVIYGAVYENGEIVPAPYAMGITWDMLSLASKYLG